GLHRFHRRKHRPEADDVSRDEHPRSFNLSAVDSLPHVRKWAEGPHRIEYGGDAVFQRDLRGFLDDALEIVFVARQELDIGPARPRHKVHIGIHDPGYDELAGRIDLARAYWDGHRVARTHRRDLLVGNDDHAIANRRTAVAVNDRRPRENHRLSSRYVRESQKQCD